MLNKSSKFPLFYNPIFALACRGQIRQILPSSNKGIFVKHAISTNIRHQVLCPDIRAYLMRNLSISKMDIGNELPILKNIENRNFIKIQQCLTRK